MLIGFANAIFGTLGVVLIIFAIGLFIAARYSRNPSKEPLYVEARRVVFQWGGGESGLVPYFARLTVRTKAIAMAIAGFLLLLTVTSH